MAVLTPKWTDTASALPDADALVRLALMDGEVWSGFLDGEVWQHAAAMPIASEQVTHWMHLLPPPVKETLHKAQSQRCHMGRR